MRVDCNKKPKEGILLQAKPASSQTPAKTCISPAVPILKPSYSHVTKLGMWACDPRKQHVTKACDVQHDL